MKISVAIAAAGLAAVLAPAAFAAPAPPSLTLTLDGVFDPTLTAANLGTPVYDYTFTGSPIIVNGTINGPDNGSVNGTSFSADPSTPGSTDVFSGSVPINLDSSGVLGPTELATIPVNPNTLDPNNIAFYSVTGGVDINDNSLSATDGIHVISAAVPEPGSAAMLIGMLGTGSMFLIRRRR